MAPVNRVGNQSGASENQPRHGVVTTRRPGSSFEVDSPRAGELDGRERQDYLESSAAAPDFSAARQRTLEELKTLVSAIRAGVTDQFQLTDLVFYARHPEMIGKPLGGDHQALLDEWNSISALLVHPTLNELGNIFGANVAGGEIQGVEEIQAAFDRASPPPASAGIVSGGRTDRFDEVIVRAVEWCPGLSPSILKGLLAQESNFNPTVINRYGYAGIAQFGREEAREVGLYVGVAGGGADERLDPHKAIPAAARLLNLKAQRLGDLAFSRYGQPRGAEFWKFVLAAYNGGEGTVALAMGNAYRAGLAEARMSGLLGHEAVSFARGYASKWENLTTGGVESPLGLAAARYFPALAVSKYQEIANYPTAIVRRSLGAAA